jgi:arylsulfatase A-like enzyme
MPLPPTYRPWGEDFRKLPAHVWNGVWIPQYDYVKSPTTLRERQVRTCQTVTGVDRFVGELREQLDRLGLADNTIIVFSTDHGLHHGEHGLGGKVFMYEQDLRIPLVVHDPRVPAAGRGQARDELVVAPDLAPTVLELCGLDPSGGMQGRSLAPLLRGEAPAWRDALFAENLFDHQNYPRCECVRTRDWKYIRYFARTEDASQAGRRIRGTLDAYGETRLRSLRGERPIHQELYHLAADPHEERDLSADASAAGVLDELRGRIDALGTTALDGQETTATLPIESRWCVRR